VTNDAKWAYLAGVTDADGSLYISKYGEATHVHYKPCIFVCGDPLLMSWLQGNIAKGSMQIRENCWGWRIYKKQLISDVLDSIIPFLTTKKQEAVILRGYLDLPSNKWCKHDKEVCYQQLRQLKRNRMKEKWVELSKLSPYQEELFSKEVYHG